MGMIWIGRHEGLLRDVARACAYGDPSAQKQAAFHLCGHINDRCILVPMPSHIGYATTMLSLCKWIRAIKNKYTGFKGDNGVVISDCLVCDPHESSHVVKLRNGVPPDIKMYQRKSLPDECGRRVYIIDNMIATGATASAALECLPNATVLSITKG